MSSPGIYGYYMSSVPGNNELATKVRIAAESFTVSVAIGNMSFPYSVANSIRCVQGFVPERSKEFTHLPLA